MITATVIASLALLLTMVFVAVILGPRRRIATERERIASVRRQAEWRIQQATTLAIAQLIAEARRRSTP